MKRLIFLMAVCSIYHASAQNPKTIIVNHNLQTVPVGKKWILETGKPVRIQVDDGVFTSGSMCNAFFLSNPRMISLINTTNESYTIIFKNPQKVPYTNDYTYDITPVAFVTRNFSVQEFRQKKLDSIGIKKIVLKSGDQVCTNNCMQTIEFVELRASKDDEVQSKMEKENEKKYEQGKAQEEWQQHVKDIKSKIYDLAVDDPKDYKSFIEIYKNDICQAAWHAKQLPNDNEVYQSSSKYFRWKNTYSEHRLVGHLDDKDVMVRNIKLISGNDTACEFLKMIKGGLPSILVDGIEVKAQVIIPTIDVDICVGFTRVQYKGDQIVFNKKCPPPSDLQEKIAKKVKQILGYDLIRYQIITIMGTTTVRIDSIKDSSRF